MVAAAGGPLGRRALRLQGTLHVHTLGQEVGVLDGRIGASEGLDSWSIERLMLQDVELEEWNGEGQPVTWSGMVSSADMALTSLEEGIGRGGGQCATAGAGDRRRWLVGCPNGPVPSMVVWKEMMCG